MFYLMMLRALLGGLKHPLVLVDAPGRFFLLRAAVPLAGRSFVIYERVHEREGCPKCQRQLLPPSGLTPLTKRLSLDIKLAAGHVGLLPGADLALYDGTIQLRR